MAGLKSGCGASERLPGSERQCLRVCGDGGWSVSEELRGSARVCSDMGTCVSLGTTLGADLISDSGRLCAGTPPLGGDIVQGQTIRESLPMENVSIVHGNKHTLSYVEEKGHCSERIDSLEPRPTLEGVERLLWMWGQ